MRSTNNIALCQHHHVEEAERGAVRCNCVCAHCVWARERSGVVEERIAKKAHEERLAAGLGFVRSLIIEAKHQLKKHLDSNVEEDSSLTTAVEAVTVAVGQLADLIDPTAQ